MTELSISQLNIISTTTQPPLTYFPTMYLSAVLSPV